MADRPVGWMELLILNESLLKEMKADVCRCLPDEACGLIGGRGEQGRMVLPVSNTLQGGTRFYICHLYTSDAADDLPCVDLGGRRIIKKKTKLSHSTSTNLR